MEASKDPCHAPVPDPSLARRGRLLLVGLVLTACGSPGVETARDPSFRDVALEFVGGASCVGCHEAETARWRGSHHDLAMQEATADTVLGDFDHAQLTYGNVTSTFFKRDGAFFVLTDGPDGEPAEYRISYTFGIDPLQQYLIEMPDGRLQALSLCWDTRPAEQGGRRWFHLYPDRRVDHEHPLHWTGPQQNWNFMCADCHSTNLVKNYDVEADVYDTSWTDIDVSCEACHGPGSRHVTWAQHLATAQGSAEPPPNGFGLAVALKDDDGGAWVFDSETLTPERSVPRTSHAELETCGRCHSRRVPIASKYVHGRPLVDSHRPSLLEKDLYHADGQILDEVYVYGSFLQSKMHAAGVTCGDCHDPHSSELILGDADKTCLQCHLPAQLDTPEHHFHPVGSTGASCVACHMPSRDYMVVDPRRDHSFRIPRPELSVQIGTPNACNDCHQDRDFQWAAEAVRRWYGPERTSAPVYAAALHAAWNRRADAEDRLLAAAGDPETPSIARASVASLLADYPSPRVLETLQRLVGDPEPLVRAAAAEGLATVDPGLRAEILAPMLDDPVLLPRLAAARTLAGSANRLPGPQARSLETALAEYRRAQWVQADRAEGHSNLGTLDAALGRLDLAERSFEQALEIDPRYLPAYVNLVDLYRTTRRDADGERRLREALSLRPDAAVLRHTLGLLLIRDRRPKEALEELASAADLAPDTPRYAFIYAVALHSQGNSAQAVDLLSVAHQRHPGDRSLLHGLATIQRDRGQYEKALESARKLRDLAPADPGVRQLIRELEGS